MKSSIVIESCITETFLCVKLHCGVSSFLIINNRAIICANEAMMCCTLCNDLVYTSWLWVNVDYLRRLQYYKSLEIDCSWLCTLSSPLIQHVADFQTLKSHYPFNVSKHILHLRHIPKDALCSSETFCMNILTDNILIHIPYIEDQCVLTVGNANHNAICHCRTREGTGLNILWMLSLYWGIYLNISSA